MRNKKNYKRNNKFKNNKKLKQKDKLKTPVDRRKRNLKFIQRSKEAEEIQRRQKLIEDKYRNDYKNYNQDASDEDEANNHEENPYDQLLSCFQSQDAVKNNVVDSSSDSSEEEDDDMGAEELENEDDVTEEQEDVEELDDIEEQSDNEENQSVPEMDSLIDSSEDSDKENDLDNNLVPGEIPLEADKEEIIVEEELDDETEKLEDSIVNTVTKCNDMFSKHLEYELAEEHIDNLAQKLVNIKRIQLSWPVIGKLLVEISIKSKNDVKNLNKVQKLLDDDKMYAEEGEPPQKIDYKNFKWNEYYIKSQLGQNIHIANLNCLKENSSENILTARQAEIFSIINNYQDLFYTHRTLDNAEELRVIYCLHALNHMLKTRTKILHHNAKLSSTNIGNNKKQSNTAIIPDHYRDQGLVRPKILILLPFRESAYRVVNTLVALFFGENSEKMKTSGGVMNYKRFEEEYTGNELRFPKRNPKPEDYERIFTGNTDDTFRIGISLTKKCIKLYTEFYSSDILIASPLGLRMIIGAPGDKERDFDFLSSIELLILDQVELFLAQNWDHLLHVLDHLHLQPQIVRNTDFSRVRTWCLNGLTKFYRQTLLFTSHELAEFRSLFNNKCFNYRGKIRTINPVIDGTIKNVIVQIPQIFHKINVTSIDSSFDGRFKYFINEILPQYKSPSMAHCMIYVPSYFDFVRLRNYFKSETINFVQICEYTKDKKIARARDMFYHSSGHFLLYSERAHFFRRTRIKGIRHLIMYQPTYWPNFYSEIINLMQDGNQNSNDGLESSMSITILYTKYDLLQISSIIGTERALKMFNSNKTTHMFMSSSN